MCRPTANAAVIFSSRIFVFGKNADPRRWATERTCAAQPEILGNPSTNSDRLGRPDGVETVTYARSTSPKTHPMSECTSTSTLPALDTVAQPGPKRRPPWISSPSKMKMNSGSSCLCVGKCAPGSKRTTCISHSPVTATSLTKTPFANVDGLHGKSAVLTDTAALGSSLVIKTPSGPRVIAKIDHSITKTALVQEIQLYPYVAGQDPPAAANHHRHDEQKILVDEPGPDRVCGEGRTTHRNIVRQLSLQVANRLRVEVPLETRLRCRDGLQRFGIDDLVGGLPDPREVQRGRRPTWNDVWRLPNRHRLVHLASIEIHADGAHKIADENKSFLVRR